MNQSNLPQVFFEVLDIVKTEFEIYDAYVEEDIPTFVIVPAYPLRKKIETLQSRLKTRGFGIIFKQSHAGLTLQVYKIPIRPLPPSRLLGLNLPLILFVATIISVTVSGFLVTSSYLDVLRILGRIKIEDEIHFLWKQTALYTLSIMCIVGLHELGHFIACRLNQIEVTFPLFIPGIPGATFGTFGAVIIQRGPTLNRDQLFDIGFSGPLIGAIIAFIVSVIGYSVSLPLSRSEYELVASLHGVSQPVFLPLIFQLLGPHLMIRGSSLILHPLALAGWMGTLITFLNIFPIGQLDGGHVAQAVLGSGRTKKLSYIAILIMFLAGWWTMAILIVLFMRVEHPGTLDDVSPLSNKKKVLATLLLVIFILYFTISPESPLAILLSSIIR